MGLFYLASNGVTIKCPNATVGDTGVVNSITYTKRNETQVEDLILSNSTFTELPTTCTSGITDMSGFFQDQSSFNEDIGSWDTSSVTTMNSMFSNSSTFNQPIGKWNTSKVTSMAAMFSSAITFDQNLTSWDVTLVSNCLFFSTGATSWQDNLKPNLTCSQCFPADAIVHSHDKGPMQMKDVRIGDLLLTYNDAGEPMYDPVYMMGHKDGESFAMFLSITASNNQTIRLTPDHYIFVVRNETMLEIPSQGVEIGDGLVVGKASILPVVAISLVKSQGLYNPYTMTGRIVVDGVLASCHSSAMLDGLFHKLGIPLSTGYQVAFEPIRFLYTLLGPRIFLRLEWILDAGADIFISYSFDDVLAWVKQVVVTSIYCTIAASSLLTCMGLHHKTLLRS